jgi:5-formyltetrahydrofolate cyclo-ligase
MERPDLEPSDELARRKADLRKTMRSRRADIPPGSRAELASRTIEHLFTLPEMAGGRTVMAFSSFGTEIPTGELLEQLHRDGYRVLLPYLDSEGDVQAAWTGPDGALVNSSYGPREPAERDPVDPAEIDLVVTPGLAFDRRGRRLGYGGGHYDRFLRRLPPSTPRVGIGFAAQVVDEVPAGPSDEPLDAVVTDEGVIRTSAR